jgi:hypothetical protein
MLGLAIAATFASCKKEEATTDQTITEIQTHADDQNRVSANLDDVTTEVNAALEASATFSGRVQSSQNTNSLCNVVAVPDTSNNTWKITLTYNGNDCSGTHHRSGTVVISTPAGTQWKMAGATVTVNLQNLKVKRLSDNKSITLNGTQTFINVSGGLVRQLPTAQSITHTIASNNMSITFDDNTQRNWHVARKRMFTYNNGIVMSIHGNGTSGSITNAAEWGTNRFGHSFTTSISQPLVFRQDCNWRLTAGEVKHQGFATSSAIFGLDKNGLPTTCPGTAAYYYKLTWTGPGGNSVTALLAY